MKLLTLITIQVFFTISSYGFTLNPNTGRGFKSNDITIKIANSDCSGAGFSTSKLKSMTENAVSHYWNDVPSSAVNLKVSGIDSNIDIDGMDHVMAINSVVPNNQVVAGCNDDADDFDNPLVLGSALMTCDGSDCKAVLILNANNSRLQDFSSSEIEAVIAHEIGHAIGLGHSESQHNLMYFSVGGKNQKWLGLDDIDGINYLYPHDSELLGIFGNCGTIQSVNDQSPFSFAKSLFFGIFLMLFLSIAYRKLFPIKMN